MRRVKRKDPRPPYFAQLAAKSQPAARAQPNALGLGVAAVGDVVDLGQRVHASLLQRVQRQRARGVRSKRSDEAVVVNEHVSRASATVLSAAVYRKMGAICTHPRYAARMPKVIQIRDVPDEVRDALAEAARAEGLSLTGYVRRELEHLARRSQRVRDNAAVVRRTQTQVRANVNRDLILSELHDGRGD